MALDPSMADPCSILNADGFPTLWVKAAEPDSTAYAKIADAGVTKTYLATLTAIAGTTMNTTSVVTSAQPSSRFRLLQFMSAGGIAANAVDGQGNPVRYDLISGLSLNSSTSSTPIYESIVDTYIVGATKGLNKTGYTYSSPEAPTVTDLNIWTAGDDTASSKVSVLGKLIAAGYLLSAAELFTQSQLTSTTNPTAGTESLIYLYRQDQSTTPLTAQQKNRKANLEARNLRFFGAFLCEYCFYRTRYEWLLSKYFTVYSTPVAGTTNGFQASAHAFSFTTMFAGSGENTKAASSPTQPELLRAIAYQMACLNTRMTDMRRLLGAINTYYNGVFTNIQATLNDASVIGSNSELTKSIKALQMSAADSSSYLSQTEFTKSVMEYNSEKNRYSNILLGLYAFLNIAALATVFQLARTS
jgi:hypothetical protein